MITGRGPGAPGMTPGLEFTRRRAGEAAAPAVAADLGEIRQAGEAIERLAARAAAPPQLRDDPAFALLTALAADVDGPGDVAPRDDGVWAGRRAPSRSLAAGCGPRWPAWWWRAWPAPPA